MVTVDVNHRQFLLLEAFLARRRVERSERDAENLFARSFPSRNPAPGKLVHLRVRIDTRRREELLELAETARKQLFAQFGEPRKFSRRLQVGIRELAHLFGEHPDDARAERPSEGSLWNGEQGEEKARGQGAGCNGTEN